MSWSVLVLLLLGLAAFWLLKRSWARGRARRRARKAASAERLAERLLRRKGYRVVARQARHTYPLNVDGEVQTVHLRCDLLVERKGQRFVAEVKSGSIAPSLRCAATRRQLLEYAVAYDVDGVLLVDGTERRVHEVEFPTE